MWRTPGKMPAQIVAEKQLDLMQDGAALEQLCRATLDGHPQMVTAPEALRVVGVCPPFPRGPRGIDRRESHLPLCICCVTHITVLLSMGSAQMPCRAPVQRAGGGRSPT